MDQEPNTTSPNQGRTPATVASAIIMPTERYPGQPPDETTLFVIYKHWISVAPFLFVAVLFMLVSLYGIYYGAAHAIEVPYLGSYAVPFIAIIGFVAAAFMIVGVVWVWRRNRVLMTNEHLVDIDQTGLFHRRVSTLDIANIQDVSSHIEGPLQTFLHYGSVIVQTAGERENFVLDYVPNCPAIEQKINEAHHSYRDRFRPKPAQPEPPPPPNPLTGDI